MQVSFKAKIPIAQSPVFDKHAKKFVKATVYEIDAKDEEDVYYVAMRAQDTPYKKEITDDIDLKYRKGQDCDYWSPKTSGNNKFYALETPDGKISALCETSSLYNVSDVRWLGSDQTGKYKCLGQTIMAAVIKQLLKDNSAALLVTDPSDKGRDFYINTCGFRPEGGRALVLEQDGMKKFLEKYNNISGNSSIDVVA